MPSIFIIYLQNVHGDKKYLKLVNIIIFNPSNE